LPGLQRLQEGIKNVLRRFLDDGALIKWSSISIEKLNRLNRGNPSICLSFVVASLHQAKESGLQQLLQPFRPHQRLMWPAVFWREPTAQRSLSGTSIALRALTCTTALVEAMAAHEMASTWERAKEGEVS
jgi:hypothetical protein